MSRRQVPPAREVTPIILAIGLAVAINVVAFGVLWDALTSQDSGLSENATQILTTAFGGIIGVLGSALGFRQGTRTYDELDPPEATRRTPPDPGRRTTMTENTHPVTDPATDPKRDLGTTPQDPDATRPVGSVEGEEDIQPDVPNPRSDSDSDKSE